MSDVVKSYTFVDPVADPDRMLADTARQNKEQISESVANMMLAIGLNVSDPNMIGTPERVAKWWAEFLDPNPTGASLDTAFEGTFGDMVVVSGIRVASLCAHHLLPFFCDVSIAYIPGTSILGLSKFARIAMACAAKPQTQELLVGEICDRIMAATGCTDVAVSASGIHLCALMRGVKQGMIMSTTRLRGSFKDNQATRQEYYSVLSQQIKPFQL